MRTVTIEPDLKKDTTTNRWNLQSCKPAWPGHARSGFDRRPQPPLKYAHHVQMVRLFSLHSGTARKHGMPLARMRPFQVRNIVWCLATTTLLSVDGQSAFQYVRPGGTDCLATVGEIREQGTIGLSSCGSNSPMKLTADEKWDRLNTDTVWVSSAFWCQDFQLTTSHHASIRQLYCEMHTKWQAQMLDRSAQ